MIAVLGYLVAVAVAGLWTILPPDLILFYTAFFLAAAGFSARHLGRRTRVPRGRSARILTAALGLLAAGMLGLAGYAFSARRPDPAAPIIDLAFPLTGGTYYVVNGGSRLLVNSHLATLDDPRFSRFRGQSYGVDLIGLNRTGTRADGLHPRDPAAYAIFGEPVHAPCTGRVIAAVDGLPDQLAPDVDRSHTEGNHVLMECQRTWVLLGHLQRGSMLVARGDSVAVGEIVGRVGNTGNSDEPHLHIHAQEPGSQDAPLTGAPVQMRFDGRFLTRNVLVRADPAEVER